MWTQRDQVQAYQFLRRRLVSALVAADANHRQSPSRRLIMGTVLGLTAVLLVTAGFGIAGVIHPSVGTSWKQGGQVIVESGTGARFVLGKDQRLHPVLNYASARLLAGGDGSRTVTVSAATLGSVPRGSTIGIPGAPDAVPTAGRLITGPWTVCTQAGADQPAGAAPTVTLLVGVAATGTALGAGDGLVVTSGSVRYLVAAGARYLLQPDAAAALGYDTARTVAVGPAWLAALPAGRPLGLLGVDGAGGAGPTVGGRGTRVGQVLRVGTVTASGSTAARLYLVRADGLVPIGATEAELVINGPSAAAAYGPASPAPVAVSAAAVAGHVVAAGVQDTGLPADVPQPAQVSGATPAVCAQTDPATDTVTVRVAAALPLPSGAAPVQPAAGGPLVADAVYVPPSSGALVAVQPAPNGPAGSRYLVTDAGLRYPITDGTAQSALGYGGVTPTGLPPALVGLLGQGPALSSAAAEAVSR